MLPKNTIDHNPLFRLSCKCYSSHETNEINFCSTFLIRTTTTMIGVFVTADIKPALNQLSESGAGENNCSC